MQIPRAVAIFNKYIGNRIQGLWAPYLPPWAVVHHRGPKSGTSFATPVVGFATSQGFVVPMLYGPSTQWVKNLIAADGGELRRRGKRYRLVRPRVIEAGDVTAGGLAGRYARSAATTLVATLEPLA